MQPYKNLAASIIEQAAKDMGKAMRRMHKLDQKIRYARQNLHDEESVRFLGFLQHKFEIAKSDFHEIEEYIMSDWCEAHCGLAGLDHNALKQGISKLIKG